MPIRLFQNLIIHVFFIFDREQSSEGPKRSFVDVVLAVVVVVGGESF